MGTLLTTKNLCWYGPTWLYGIVRPRFTDIGETDGKVMVYVLSNRAKLGNYYVVMEAEYGEEGISSSADVHVHGDKGTVGIDWRRLMNTLLVEDGHYEGKSM